MLKRENGISTICTHSGSVDDNVYGGATSPIYMSTSYSFVDNITNRYFLQIAPAALPCSRLSVGS